MKNHFKQIVRDGKTFNVLALPGTNVFKLEIRNTIGATIETELYDKYGMSLFGVSHLVEHLSFKSTRDYESNELLNKLKKYGSRNAATSFNHLNFFYTTIMKHIDFAINAIVNIAYNDLTGVLQEEFESEKSVVINEVKRYNDNHQLMFSINRETRLMNKHPEANILGSPEGLSKITLSDVINLKAIYNESPNKHINIIYDPIANDGYDIEDIIFKITSEINQFEEEIMRASIDFDFDNYRQVDLIDYGTNVYPDEAKQSMIHIFIPNKANIIARHLGDLFTREQSGDNSMFNIIRDKHGLTYGVGHSHYSIKNVCDGTYFSADVTEGNETKLVELFKEIVISMPDHYTLEKHHELIETLYIENALDNMNLNTYSFIFTYAANNPNIVYAIMDTINEDMSEAYLESIKRFANYETVLTYLNSMKNSVLNNEMIILKNK